MQNRADMIGCFFCRESDRMDRILDVKGEKIMSVDYEDKRPGRETMDVGAIFRGIASLLGLGIIILGLYLALKTYTTIQRGVTEPVTFQETVKKWTEVMDVSPKNDPAAAAWDEKTRFEAEAVAQVMGVVAIGGAYFILCWLTVAIMTAGARIISWTTGDREAVRKIIREALGTRTRV
jgi:hypothetical protein